MTENPYERPELIWANPVQFVLARLDMPEAVDFFFNPTLLDVVEARAFLLSEILFPHTEPHTNPPYYKRIKL